MGLDVIPGGIREKFQIEERRHACTILENDFPNELMEILDCLDDFQLMRSEIIVGGGGKTRIASRFDEHLYRSRLPLTLTQSASEGVKSFPRSRFGLVWLVTTSTASSIEAVGWTEKSVDVKNPSRLLSR